MNNLKGRRDEITVYPDSFRGGGLLLAAGAALVYWNFKYIVTDHGLEMRMLFMRKYVRWPDVSDYYLDSRGKYFCLDTPSGRFRIFPLVSDFPVLLEEIHRRAINSKSKEWARRTATKRAGTDGNGNPPAALVPRRRWFG